jgi:hypothetical protein
LGLDDDDFDATKGIKDISVRELKKEVRKKENTDGMNEYIISFPNHVEISKKKSFMEEIGWCIYASACSFQRKQLPFPYYEDIIKNESSGLFGLF